MVSRLRIVRGKISAAARRAELTRELPANNGIYGDINARESDKCYIVLLASKY